MVAYLLSLWYTPKPPFIKVILNVDFFLKETIGHVSTKAAKSVFVGDNFVFTTGFSRRSDRQYMLWDVVSGFSIFLKNISSFIFLQFLVHIILFESKAIYKFALYFFSV